MKVLSLVPLAGVAGAHEVLHNPFHVRDVEIAPQTVQGAKNALMAFLVHGRHDLAGQG
jgi:hypothetical protein